MPFGSSEFLFRDFFLNGVMKDGHNFTIKDLPVKSGDQVKVYYYDIGQSSSQVYPTTWNDREWAKSSPAALQDFENDNLTIFMGAFVYPFQKIDKTFGVGLSPKVKLEVTQP